MPVYDMIEYQLVKRRIPNGFLTRLVYRTTYIVLVGFIAITLPYVFFPMHWMRCSACAFTLLAPSPARHVCPTTLHLLH